MIFNLHKLFDVKTFISNFIFLISNITYFSTWNICQFSYIFNLEYFLGNKILLAFDIRFFFCEDVVLFFFFCLSMCRENGEKLRKIIRAEKIPRGIKSFLTKPLFSMSPFSGPRATERDGVQRAIQRNAEEVIYCPRGKVKNFTLLGCLPYTQKHNTGFLALGCLVHLLVQPLLN